MLAKISAKGSFFVISPNLISPIARIYLPGRVVDGAHELLCTYVCASTIARECVEIFTAQKTSQKKFLPMECIGEIGENFLLAKISTYTVVADFRQHEWITCNGQLLFSPVNIMQFMSIEIQKLMINKIRTCNVVSRKSHPSNRPAIVHLS